MRFCHCAEFCVSFAFLIFPSFCVHNSATCTLPVSITSSAGYVTSGCAGTIAQSACSLSCDASGGYSGSPVATCSAPGDFSVTGTCDRMAFGANCFFFLPSSSSFSSAFVFNGCNRIDNIVHIALMKQMHGNVFFSRFLFFFCHFSTIQAALIHSNGFLSFHRRKVCALARRMPQVRMVMWLRNVGYFFPPRGTWIRCVRPPSLSSGTPFFSLQVCIAKYFQF